MTRIILLGIVAVAVLLIAPRAGLTGAVLTNSETNRSLLQNKGLFEIDEDIDNALDELDNDLDDIDFEENNNDEDDEARQNAEEFFRDRNDPENYENNQEDYNSGERPRRRRSDI